MSPLIRVSEIESRHIEWLWEPFVPLGKFTDIAGQMGQGKSLVTIWLAAEVTTASNPGSVLMYAGEDDYGDTVRPRLEAAGADLDRVHRVTDESMTTDAIKTYCAELGDVQLVTADPITGYFPKGVDPWNTPQVRRFLLPHVDLAAKQRFLLVGVQHINRRGDNDPLARIADAQGLPQVARSVLVFGPDPTDPDGDGGSLKVLAVAKGNNVAGRPAAGFLKQSATVAKGITTVRITHEGGSDVQAGDLLNDQDTRSQTQEAITWLADYLKGGEVEAKAVESDAGKAGISSKCLRTARERIAISYRPLGNHGPYAWRLKGNHRDSPMKTKGQSGHSRATTRA